jgi:hypothetical protein
MTEAEWKECTDPHPMLHFLKGRVSNRKLRLFAVACCRRIWHLLPDEPCRHAVEVSETFAEGKASKKDLAVAAAIIQSSKTSHVYKAAKCCAYQKAYSAATQVAVYSPAAFAAPLWGTDSVNHRWGEAISTEKRGLVAPLDDIFGNPFRPVTLDPSWLAWNDRIIPTLAQAIYDHRAFDRLPLLADALVKSGCANEVILGHCRGPGPHVRGCWALDLVLGKG